MATLTSDAKQLLSTTIRSLRERLLRDIHDEANRRYRLSVSLQEAGLDEAQRRRRERLEAWLDERVRASKPKNKAEEKTTRERLLKQAEKEAATTLVNRLIVLRHMEALGLSKPAVVTGGWNSKGYREFRGFAATLCTNGTTDETEGYATLLQLLFDELSIDLPGLFGDVGLTRLFAIPAATLREIIEKLDVPELLSAWTDDTTLGWVYQYWNDPERAALDAKISSRGKLQPHEIASKTQMFTERYMVEWLLQNSLGLTWLCICKKNGWTPDAEPVLRDLDVRRAEFRTKREAGEVALYALMPIHGELEEHWKYFVPQPIPDDAVTQAPESIRRVKLLDPATGSGHFLVIAFGLLTAMYREEAKHRGDSISDRAIAESILENNLFGIDIDPRAIQIAAAALYLKAKSLSKDARPKSLNLVAPVFQLGTLPEGDPAVVKLRQDLKRDVDIPEDLTNHLLKALSGVDYLGSLFKVDAALNETIEAHEQGRRPGVQLPLGETATPTKRRDSDSVRLALVEKIEHFLHQHTRSEDLGLRLDGEQLAAGVRFMRMARERAYNVVVGNPPYQALSKTEGLSRVAATYPKGKADLYAAFLERGLDLVQDGGLSALVTMRGWMFLGQFADLREAVLTRSELCCVGDLDIGAFEEVGGAVVTAAMSVLRNSVPGRGVAVALKLSDTGDGIGRTAKKRAALLAQIGRYEFDPRGFAVIETQPIVYWWSDEFLQRYAKARKLGATSPGQSAWSLGDNTRLTRCVWEIAFQTYPRTSEFSERTDRSVPWHSFVNGSDGLEWIEPLREVIRWGPGGIHLKLLKAHRWKRDVFAVSTESYFHCDGVAFAQIGNRFSARAHRYASVLGNKGSSVFPTEISSTLCTMNSHQARYVLESLNPGIGFEVGDVNRLAMFPVESAGEIYATLENAFAEHESAREPSVEFRRLGSSSWRSAQQWAQAAVDRPSGAELPAFNPEYDPPESSAFISFALGIAMGRLGAGGEGVLDAPPESSLPGGILFLSPSGQDSLSHAACYPLHEAWREHREAIGEGEDLRTYLQKRFFSTHNQRTLYDGRPISFSAFVVEEELRCLRRDSPLAGRHASSSSR